MGNEDLKLKPPAYLPTRGKGGKFRKWKEEKERSVRPGNEEKCDQECISGVRPGETGDYLMD